MGKHAVIAAIGVFLVGGLAAASARSSGGSPGTVLWISDIHFDPFYVDQPEDDGEVKALMLALVDSDGSAPRWKDVDQWAAVLMAQPLQGDAYSQRYADTNFKLLDDLLDRAALISPDPDFILITGDFLGHNFGEDYYQYAPSKGDLMKFPDADLRNDPDAYRSFVRHTLAFIAYSIRSRYPLKTDPSGSGPDAPPVYAALGNNDANCGDYDIHLDGKTSLFLADAAQTFLDYFLVGQGVSDSDRKAFMDSFPKGGYYAVTPRRSPGNRLVLLNTIPFLPGYPNIDKGDRYPPTETSCAALTPVDAAAELNWLDGRLPTQSGSRVWIAAHVPPGEDCYSGRHHAADPYWESGYTQTFKGQLLDSKHRASVTGILAAHSHSAEFKLVRDGGAPFSFVLMAPSVSPNHGNNPSFRVMDYDRKTLEITDYHTHYKDLFPSSAADCETASNCWQHFSFQTGYHVDSVDAVSLDLVFRQFGNGQQSPAREYAVDMDTRSGNSGIAGTPTKPRWVSFPGCIGSLDGAYECAAAGDSCTSDTCCFGSCQNGSCVCAGKGVACAGDIECCSGNCVNGSCG